MDTSAENDSKAVENWGGKNKPPATKKTRKRQSILEPHDLRRNNAGVPILKNGHSSKRGLVTVSTCAFDCIFSIFACAYADFDFFEEFITTRCDHNFLFGFIKKCVDSKTRSVSAQMYEERNQLLKRIYSDSYYKSCVTQTNNLTYIDCETGLATLFAQIVAKGNEDMASAFMEEKCKCKGRRAVRALIGLQQRNLKLGDINKYINHASYHDSYTACKACKGTRKSTYSFSRIIALEVEPINRGAEVKIAIKDVTDEVVISGIAYGLYGVIEHKKDMAHFVAYIKRRQVWETFDDLNPASSKKSLEAESHKLLETPILPWMLFYMQKQTT